MAQSKGHVLLTGGTGFIASHILDVLLDQGFTVVTTVRTVEKGTAVLASIPVALRARVSYVVVDDMSRDGAFDGAFAGPEFDYVIHTASPYQLHAKDAVRDFLDPAIRGTQGLLRSVQQNARSVRRIVVTSSSAAMITPGRQGAVYDESCWRSMTWAEAQLPQNAYEASKVFAERCAWAFVNGGDLETATETAEAAEVTEGSSFDLAVINCAYTFGPVQRWLSGLDAVNASNHRIRDLVLGQWQTSSSNGTGMPPTRPVFTWVDVRDVALAHVRAMVVPEAGGRRFYVVGGYFSNGRLAGIARTGAEKKERARLRERIPPEDETPDDLPADVYKFDNRRSRDVLGIDVYRSLEESVLDTVDSLLALEQRD